MNKANEQSHLSFVALKGDKPLFPASRMYCLSGLGVDSQTPRPTIQTFIELFLFYQHQPLRVFPLHKMQRVQPVTFPPHQQDPYWLRFLASSSSLPLALFLLEVLVVSTSISAPFSPSPS